MTEPFFLRFRWSDPSALAQEIAEVSAAHATAIAAHDTAAEIDTACRLGVALTAADREAEAAALLERTLTKARSLGDMTLTGWNLLYLATARQYLGDRASAHVMFAEALGIAQAHALPDLESYICHHRGRCYAEERNIANAKSCFERALKLRLELGDPRAERSREALALLPTRPT